MQCRLLSTATEGFEWIFDCLGMCPSLSAGSDPTNPWDLLTSPLHILHAGDIPSVTPWRAYRVIFNSLAPKGFAVPFWQSPGHGWFCCGIFPALPSWGFPSVAPPLLAALHACPLRTIFGLNIPVHSPTLTVGMSIPISCKHFSRIKDPDCRQPNRDSAPCGFPGIRPGRVVGAASPSPACPVGRHLLIHPHLPLPQAHNATARAPQHHPLLCCSENSCLTRALLIFLEHRSCCWHPGRSMALLPVSSGRREGVFHARLGDNPSTTLNQRLDFPSLCSWECPQKDAGIGYRVWTIPVGMCCSSTLYSAPEVHPASVPAAQLFKSRRRRRQGRKWALLALT